MKLSRRSIVMGYLASSACLVLPVRSFGQDSCPDDEPVLDTDPCWSTPRSSSAAPVTATRTAADQAVWSDLQRVYRRLGQFFSLTADAAFANPPPGVAATNGWFIRYMNENAALDVAVRPISTTTNDGAQCAEIALLFMQKVKAGFSRGLHNAHWLGNWDLALKAFNNMLPQLLIIAAEIVAMIYTSGAASAALGNDAQQRINNLGAVSGRRGPIQGNHANGWIPSDLQGRMSEWMADMEGRKASLSPQAQDFCEILKVFAGKIASRTGDRGPHWLKADFQIAYASIATAGVQVMNNPPV